MAPPMPTEDFELDQDGQVIDNSPPDIAEFITVLPPNMDTMNIATETASEIATEVATATTAAETTSETPTTDSIQVLFLLTLDCRRSISCCQL
jgi:hypothetical protein